MKSRTIYTTRLWDMLKLDGFTDTTWGGITVDGNSSTKRILELALPPVQLTEAQTKELKKAIDQAAKQGVQVVVKIVE